MSLIPPEFSLLLGAAFVAKALNRKPPLWERLLAGARYYDVPYRTDVERVLGAAVARDVAPWAPARATLVRLAGEAVDTRARAFTYSHYPIRAVPWESLVGVDALAALAVSALYAALAAALAGGWEAVTGAPRSLHSDAVTVAALAVALLAPASHLRKLGRGAEVSGRGGGRVNAGPRAPSL